MGVQLHTQSVKVRFKKTSFHSGNLQFAGKIGAVVAQCLQHANDGLIDQPAPQDARKKCRQETPAVDRTDRLNAKNGCHRQGNATIYKSDEHAHREVRENALPELIAAIPTAQRFFIPELYRTRRSPALIRAETPECS